MAEKIFQQLDQLDSPLKEKLSELKVLHQFFGSAFGSTTSKAGSSFGTSSAADSSAPSIFDPSTTEANDQMNMEDSMAEDTIQASNPIVPSFGQPANSPPPVNDVFCFGAPAGGSPFLFDG
ncbi:hypothetical protein FRX31_005220 [Thalictrum thalictroides]|uniref:Uncharacterized protein n=1 Tax=Thalictrum thalictroides TaxID=46969 RepID=A0A7J6X9V2_THATH|nr:hypothetical protein FRX31_005220 [Thalictrum thalictroides]